MNLWNRSCTPSFLGRTLLAETITRRNFSQTTKRQTLFPMPECEILNWSIYNTKLFKYLSAPYYKIKNLKLQYRKFISDMQHLTPEQLLEKHIKKFLVWFPLIMAIVFFIFFVITITFVLNASELEAIINKCGAIITNKIEDTLNPLFHEYYYEILYLMQELGILIDKVSNLVVAIDTVQPITTLSIDGLTTSMLSNIDGIPTTMLNVDGFTTTIHVKSPTHPLGYILDKCHIHIFNFNRPYFPSYFVPYTFIDLSHFDIISYNNLSPLDKLKLMQNISLDPETFSLYKQLIKTANQKELFLIEYDKLISNLNSMDNGQPGLFSDFDRSGSMASIDMINQFVPQLEERIANLIKEWK